MWQPWVSHWFPRYGKSNMDELGLLDYLGMWDFVRTKPDS